VAQELRLVCKASLTPTVLPTGSGTHRGFTRATSPGLKRRFVTPPGAAKCLERPNLTPPDGRGSLTAWLPVTEAPFETCLSSFPHGYC